MFRPSDLIIDAFVRFLRDAHEQAFADADPAFGRAIERAARLALPRIATSDALFHDLDHALCVVQVGQDMLRGRIIRDGDVSPADWAHGVAALLCLNVGQCEGAVDGDVGRHRVIDAEGGAMQLPEGSTDGAMWEVANARSQLFVRQRFVFDPVLDAERLAVLIAAGRFPPEPGQAAATGIPALMLDAHLIGILANPRFVSRLTPFFLELQESGMAERMGLTDRTAFHADYPSHFWTAFAPRIQQGMELLAYTGAGRTWLATLRAHVLRREHDVPAR